MVRISLLPVALAALLALPAAAQDKQPRTPDQSTRDYVVQAVTELFVQRDVTAIDRYWAEDYRQRNPRFPSGADVIRELFGNLPEAFRYEIGMVIAEDDLVAIHGRYTGLAPEPTIAVDIFRVEDGLIAEHWDVLQPEVSETASGLPMFEPMATGSAGTGQ